MTYATYPIGEALLEVLSIARNLWGGIIAKQMKTIRKKEDGFGNPKSISSKNTKPPLSLKPYVGEWGSTRKEQA